ncbi:hypothetical protein INR49_001352 [Caranx melampygus]|nr:hypothetical protein INR49_001352 [Caranx melampygus]
MTFGPGRTVSARLQWSVPDDLDVPIHHYKVSWSWTAVGQSSASSLTKRRKTVRESQVELDSMRSNRSYSVEVQAVSYWGQTQLKGPRAVLHFTTQRSVGLAPKKPSGDTLDVGTPFYQDGQLRGSFVSLQGLLFACKYKVLLQPISKKGRPLAESTSFFTPSCAAIQAKSPKSISCPGETVSPQKVLVKAANLTASFEVLGGNVTAIFSWDLSRVPLHQQLTGFQDGNVLVVSGLHPASLYRLEVQAITAEGEGPATSRTFQTPGYQSAPKHRSRLRKHQHKQPVINRH